MTIYVFAYGSLMCPQSCARTLKREVCYYEALLSGYERTFDASGKAFSEKLNQHVSVKFANLQVCCGKQCSGLIFAVSEQELQILAKREYFYDIEEVTEQVIHQAKDVNKIYTFICHQNTNEGYILEKYLAVMLNASGQYPQLQAQILKEFDILKNKPSHVIAGGFIGISGHYPEEQPNK